MKNKTSVKLPENSLAECSKEPLLNAGLGFRGNLFLLASPLSIFCMKRDLISRSIYNFFLLRLRVTCCFKISLQ